MTQEIDIRNSTSKSANIRDYNNEDELIRQKWDRIPEWLQEALLLSGFRR